MLLTVWEFLKNPLYLQDENKDFAYRKKVFLKLLFATIGCTIALGIVGGICSTVFNIDLGSHKIDLSFSLYPKWQIALLAIVIAPIFEELLFRAPLYLVKNSSFFNYFFYASFLLFGIVHITNYENFENNIFFAVFLVLPQISAGIFFGYIRVRFGLLWSIALHASFNFLLFLPFLFSFKH
ncbi:MAG: CPBP family intramembrane glutamic endopeptidase [Cellulophaga sp.]